MWCMIIGSRVFEEEVKLISVELGALGDYDSGVA
jgi:hypothetical protein